MNNCIICEQSCQGRFCTASCAGKYGRKKQLADTTPKPTQKCLSCDAQTTNPKFCSRSCSAKFNNSINPKRKKTIGVQRKYNPRGSLCAVCETNETRSSICRQCRNKNSTEKWLRTTKREIFGDNGNARYSRKPYIHSTARAWYAKHREMSCMVCGYDAHVDICHIRAVADFPDTATVAEMNAPSNLIALCKNHHWEFDNNLLVLQLVPLHRRG